MAVHGCNLIILYQTQTPFPMYDKCGITKMGFTIYLVVCVVNTKSVLTFF